MDYLIVEAVHLKAAREERDMQAQFERDAEMKQKKKEATAELQRLFPATGR